MTGEITLRGRILPIGGLREKTMAAYRNDIHTVIIPADNESDLNDIDPTVRASLDFVTTSHADSVIDIALRKSIAPIGLEPVPADKPDIVPTPKGSGKNGSATIRQ